MHILYADLEIRFIDLWLVNATCFYLTEFIIFPKSLFGLISMIMNFRTYLELVARAFIGLF